MKSRRTVRIDDSIYKELTEIATKVKKDTIANQLEIAIKDYIVKQSTKEDYILQNALLPIDNRLTKLEEHLLDVLFKIRLDVGIVLNLVIPLATNYITRTDKEILKKVMDELDGIYEAARRKTVKQLRRKEEE